MLFRTILDIKHSANELTYDNHFLLLGSCFTDNIGQRLLQAQFNATTNPFGVLYNPMSIASCLRILLGECALPEPIFYDGLWHSMMHHGSFSCADQLLFEQGISDSIEQGRVQLQQADCLIITLGSAWIYEYDNYVVANCHKLPDKCFSRRRLTIEEIVCEYRSLLAHPALQGKRIIMTVSPIRHLRDGLHDNQLSKSALLLAIDSLRECGVEYFPAYELLMDDLRDYRFYAEDMLHPSSVAVDYVWERFQETYFSAATIAKMRIAEKAYKHQHHRPLHG